MDAKLEGHSKRRETLGLTLRLSFAESMWRCQRVATLTCMTFPWEKGKHPGETTRQLARNLAGKILSGTAAKREMNYSVWGDMSFREKHDQEECSQLHKSLNTCKHTHMHSHSHPLPAAKRETVFLNQAPLGNAGCFAGL